MMNLEDCRAYVLMENTLSRPTEYRQIRVEIESRRIRSCVRATKGLNPFEYSLTRRRPDLEGLGDLRVKDDLLSDGERHGCYSCLRN
jgi:hypothetical protein